MYLKKIAVVKVGNEVSCTFLTKSGVKQGCILSQFIWIIFMDFVPRRTAKVMREYGINWGSKTLLDLDDTGDLSILDENFNKMK
jgi:hypothetical protein